MIKVFEIILCMYLKTISPDVPRFTFVCSIYKKNIGQAIILVGKCCHCRINIITVITLLYNPTSYKIYIITVITLLYNPTSYKIYIITVITLLYSPTSYKIYIITVITLLYNPTSYKIYIITVITHLYSPTSYKVTFSQQTDYSTTISVIFFLHYLQGVRITISHYMLKQIKGTLI